MISTLIPAIVLSCALVSGGCTSPRVSSSPDPAAVSVSTAPTASASTEPPLVSSSSAALAPMVNSVPTTSASPQPRCARMVWVSACEKRSAATWLDGAALSAWYQSRGAKPPQNEIEPSCREIAVGVRGEAALFCERIQHQERGRPGTPLYTFRVLGLISVRTVRAKRAVTLLEVPFLVDVLDKEELDEGPLFALDVDDLGLPGRLVFREPEEGACAKAEQKLKSERDEARASKDAVMTAWTRLDEEMRARLCGAVGDYVFQNDRFVREPPRAAPRP